MILPAPLKKGEQIKVPDLSKDSFSFAALSKWFPTFQELHVPIFLYFLLTMYAVRVILLRNWSFTSFSFAKPLFPLSFPGDPCFHSFWCVFINSRQKKNFSRRQAPPSQQATLEVHSVGNYFISLAGNLADLERIDPNVFTVPFSLDFCIYNYLFYSFCFPRWRFRRLLRKRTFFTPSFQLLFLLISHSP